MTITPEISVAIAFAIFVILVLWKGTRKITEGSISVPSASVASSMKLRI